MMAEEQEPTGRWSDHVAHLLRGIAIEGGDAEACTGQMRSWPELDKETQDHWRQAAMMVARLAGRHALAEHRERLRAALAAEVQAASAVLRQPGIRRGKKVHIDAVSATTSLLLVERLAEQLGVALDDIQWKSAAVEQPVLQLLAPQSAPEAADAD